MSPKKIRSWRKFKKISLKSVDKRSKKIETATAKHAHRFLVSRIENLHHIKRHLIAWLLLVIILISLNAAQVIFNQFHIGTPQPAEDNAYAEGVLGPFNNLNPLFATKDAEVTASKLMFSSLLSYDTTGRLQGDAAQSYRIDDNGRNYVINLRPNLKWHDGKQLTAADVVFTVHVMQNPATGAKNLSSWQGIKVVATSPSQVSFTLPAGYAPFASALTFPILPEHILGQVPADKLQEDNFGQNPIGSGPFKYIDLQTIDVGKEKNALHLEKNENYWAGAPKLARFSLYIYGSQNDLKTGLQRREINAAVGVHIDTAGLKTLDIPINNGVYALLRTDSPILKDKLVRQALVQATDRQALIKELGVGRSLEGPMINSQTPKANKVSQLAFQISAAKQQLTANGWVQSKNGIRQKAGAPLELRLVAVDTANYRKIAKLLANQWKKIGVKTVVQMIDPEQIQQIILQPRDYDVLVYELSQGGDPDSYAFWHSSQASSTGLNFANYVSTAADDALITARGRTSMDLRDDKYTIFARRWVEDAPAIALYRSSLRYAVTDGTQSLGSTNSLIHPTDRFYDVTNWSSETYFTHTTP